MNVAGPCQASRRCRKDATIAMRQRLAANDRRPRPGGRSGTVPRLKSNAGSVETSELRHTRRAVESSEVQCLFLGSGHRTICGDLSDREDRCGS